MHLFKILGRYEQNGKWSNREADFTGYFVKRKNTSVIIEGYIEKKVPIINEKVKYIKGIYMQDSKMLVFVEMSNNALIMPVVYVFKNIKKQGYWDVWSPYRGVFKRGENMGHAKIKIEEVVAWPHITKKVINIYEENVCDATFLNRKFMEQTYELIDLFEYPFYPKDCNKKKY